MVLNRTIKLQVYNYIKWLAVNQSEQSLNTHELLTTWMVLKEFFELGSLIFDAVLLDCGLSLL